MYHYLASYSMEATEIQRLHPMPLLHSVYVGYPQTVNTLVEFEMNRIREQYFCYEQQYVEQMMEGNPTIFEHRSHQQQTSSEDEIDVVNVTDTIGKESHILLQRERAEASRRSRYKNKIEEAKSKYYHRFISKKLLESTRTYDSLQMLIAQTENQLLGQGLSIAELQAVRNNYGMEEAINGVRSFEHIIKMEE